MAAHALPMRVRAVFDALWYASALVIHTARGYDLFLISHLALLDLLNLLAITQTTDYFLVGLALGRFVLEALAMGHAVVTLARDHLKWWSGLRS